MEQIVPAGETQILIHTWVPTAEGGASLREGAQCRLIFFFSLQLSHSRIVELKVKAYRKEKTFLYNISSNLKFYLNMPPHPFRTSAPTRTLCACLIKQPQSSAKILDN